MFKNKWPAPGSSNWLTAVFACGSLSFLAVTLAGALGPDATLLLMRGAVLGIFVLGGGLCGLMIAHHVGQTHLPDRVEEQPTTLRTVPPAAHPRGSNRGFLSLFGGEAPAAESSRQTAPERSRSAA